MLNEPVPVPLSEIERVKASEFSPRMISFSLFPVRVVPLILEERVNVQVPTATVILSLCICATLSQEPITHSLSPFFEPFSTRLVNSFFSTTGSTVLKPSSKLSRMYASFSSCMSDVSFRESEQEKIVAAKIAIIPHEKSFDNLLILCPLFRHLDLCII